MSKVIGGKNKFVDDPEAEVHEANGTYYSKYDNSTNVCIGKPMTIEEAMFIRNRDKDFSRNGLYKSVHKGEAQKAYYWRNRDKILQKLHSQKAQKKGTNDE